MKPLSKYVSLSLLTSFVPSSLTLFLCIFPSYFILLAGELWAERPPTLTLEKAIEIALMDGPSVKIKQAELFSSQQAKNAAMGRLLPQINAYAGYSRLSDLVAVVPIKGFGGDPPYFSKDQYLTGINFNLPIYKGGLWAELKKADKEAMASKKSLIFVQESLARQVTDTFFGILYLEALLKAKQTTLSALEVQRQNAETALKTGRVAPLDLMDIDTQVASQRQELVSTREALSRMRQYLALLLGWDPNQDFSLNGDIDNADDRFDAWLKDMGPIEGKTIKALIDKRADIQEAKRRVEAARQALRATKDLHLPSLELVGDYGRRAGWGFTGDEEVWSLGINLSLNLFNGGSISARVAQTEAKLIAAKERLRSLDLQAKSQVLSALSALKEARARLELSKSVQNTAREAFRIESLKYEKGAGTVTDMLKAQAVWTQAKVSLVKALYDKVSAITALRLYTGKMLEGTKLTAGEYQLEHLEKTSWQR